MVYKEEKFCVSKLVYDPLSNCGIIVHVKCSNTYVCGWVGSSPRETVSPWISLKHFSQKWYLLAISPNFGELHRSPQHSQSQTAHGRAVTKWDGVGVRQVATSEASRK